MKPCIFQPNSSAVILQRHFIENMKKFSTRFPLPYTQSELTIFTLSQTIQQELC